MTTDTVAKTATERSGPGGRDWTVGGMAKGAGMLAPGLATMLVVVTTDAVADADTLARVLPAALMLAVDRALLATALSRAHTDADGPEQRQRSRPKIPLVLRTKIALRAHGVRRTRSLLANLRTVGPTGLLRIARDVARLPDPRGKSTARSAYQIERGAGHLLLDGCTEPFPDSGAAALAGVYEFLDGLPELSERRRWLQQSRRRSDAEIIGRFGRNWLSPGPAHHQLEHEELHHTLLETLGIAALARTWDSTPVSTEDAGVRSGATFTG
jgi:hypothetical protein